jgi:hypothetical protein
MVAPPATQPAATPGKRRTKMKKQKRQQANAVPKAVPVVPPPGPAPAAPLPIPPAADTAQTFDVELIPGTPAPTGGVGLPPALTHRGPLAPLAGVRLTRRDFLMFGIGVGTVAAGILVGLGVVKVVEKVRQQDPPPEEDNSTPE